MQSLPITTGATAVLGLVLSALSSQVIRARFRARVSLGEGGVDTPLFHAIRAQANFIEYVPMALLLIGGVEASGGPKALVWSLASALVVARISHPFGLPLPAPNVPRLVGIVATLSVIVVASLWLLAHVAGLAGMR